jgi:HPt (histidine-containing phosphotransfer) domain-containing protein
MISGAQKKVFDLSCLELLNDKNFLVQVIELYLLDSQKDMQDLMQAVADTNYDTVHQIGHKLKSSTGMLQANRLYDLLETIEKTAKLGEKQSIPHLFQSANYEYNQLKNELQVFLKEN